MNDIYINLTIILELIGTVAFAISGGVIAINKRFDYFGIVMIAITTAVGGGIIRDLILGNIPPNAFKNPIYAGVALMTGIILMVVVTFFNRHLHIIKKKGFIHLFNFCDSLGLGIFTIVGMNQALQMGYKNNIFLLVFVGLITGVGGGILRDLMVGRRPMVLKKEIYAVASIIGGISYKILVVDLLIAPLPGMMIACCLIIGIRMISLKYQLNLPIVKKPE